jgi:hypothetical protein
MSDLRHGWEAENSDAESFSESCPGAEIEERIVQREFTMPKRTAFCGRHAPYAQSPSMFSAPCRIPQGAPQTNAAKRFG